VRIAEYWVKEPIKKTLAVTNDGKTIDITDKTDPQVQAAMSAGIKRTVERNGFKICWYKISGAEVLEGPTEWKGKYLPIVPVLGEEVFLEQRVVRKSVIADAMEAQQLYNFFCSAQAEYIASQPKSPFLGTHENFKKNAKMWAQANRKNFPYLAYTPDSANGGAPPQRQQPPVGSPGFDESMARAAEDLKSTTGIYDASLGNKSNETSGKAILARQREGDTANYVYYEQFNRGVSHTARIIIDLIPHYYDTARIVRVLGQDGAEKFIKINCAHGPDGNPLIGPDGVPVVLYDMSVGRYDLVMDSGPSFASRRDEARDGMERLMHAAPQTAPYWVDLYAKSLDWPFAQEIGDRLKAVRPPDPSAAANDPKAQAEMAQQKELQMRGAMAEVAVKEAEAHLKNAQAVAAVQPKDQAATDKPGPHEVEIEAIQKEAARFSAWAAYWQKEAAMIAAQGGPPTPAEVPDPMAQQIDHLAQHAAVIGGAADLVKAHAAYETAKNPPPVAAPAKPAPKGKKPKP